jgi:hypothetical protein
VSNLWPPAVARRCGKQSGLASWEAFQDEPHVVVNPPARHLGMVPKDRRQVTDLHVDAGAACKADSRYGVRTRDNTTVSRHAPRATRHGPRTLPKAWLAASEPFRSQPVIRSSGLGPEWSDEHSLIPVDQLRGRASSTLWRVKMSGMVRKCFAGMALGRTIDATDVRVSGSGGVCQPPVF